jgi:hypothetical protein
MRVNKYGVATQKRPLFLVHQQRSIYVKGMTYGK